MAFANSRDSPLPTLRKEEDEVFSTLSRRMAEGHYVVHRESSATTAKVVESLILFRDMLSIFLYSGHAGRDRLLLEDEDANSIGIAKLLSRCPRLKLVMLNGCSTGGQVAKLLELGVPVVIGTSAPVDDEAATRFSTSFFQAFSERRESIRDAFEAGFAAAQVSSREELQTVHDRGIKVDKADKGAVWGLFCEEENAHLLDWKLPSFNEAAESVPYEPNEAIIEALTESLAPYNETLAEIREQEEFGGEASISDKQKAILESLPHPISEQLRKLLAPKDDNSQSAVFFDRPGMDRLQQLTTTYNTIMEFLAFIMLGQLWDAASEEEEKLEIASKHYETIKAFFQLKKNERPTYNFLPLIRSIRLTFDDNEIPYFISELQELQQTFNSDSPFHFACTFLETLKQRLPRKEIGDGEARALCKTVEERLADVLLEFGFLANYTLTSVKDVGVLKYRHRKEVRFKHKLVKLVQKFVKLAEEQTVYLEMLDTASVILLKNDKEKIQYLNLSPFIIDENAFEERVGNVSKLHFFERYEPMMDCFLFRHVYKPGDQLLAVQKQREYRMIKEQFNVFSNLLFEKPMKAL